VRKRYVALIIFLLLVGWAGWIVIRAMSAKPGLLVDYGRQLLDTAGEMQPAGENGWPIMVQAIDRLNAIGLPDVPDWPTDKEASENIRLLARVREGAYDPVRLKLELIYLDHIRASGALELLDDFAAHPRYVREAWQEDALQGLLFVLLPELASSRNVARARGAAMRVAAENDDMDELVRAWRHLVSLGHAMSFDPTLISHLVGVSIVRLGCDELDHIITQHDLDEATCRRLLAIMDEQAILAPMSAVLERERLMGYDTIQRTHSDDGNGDGILLIGRLEELSAFTGSSPLGLSGRHRIYNVAGLIFPSRAETTRTLDAYFDAAEEQANMPRAERPNHPVNLDEFLDALPRFQFLLRLTLPAIGNTIAVNDIALTQIDATRLLLAIEMHEAKYGRLPAALSDLSPEFLAEIPEDAVACRPFIYMPREPSKDDPRTFWLYSIAADGVDNGGAESPRRDTDALRGGLITIGFDHIFNRLRDPYSDKPADTRAIEESGREEGHRNASPPQTDAEGG